MDTRSIQVLFATLLLLATFKCSSDAEIGKPSNQSTQVEAEKAQSTTDSGKMSSPTHTPTVISTPIVSTIGEIAFLGFPTSDTLISDVFLVNADGTEMQHLELSASIWSLSWMPDRNRLLVSAAQPGTRRFVIISADGNSWERIRTPNKLRMITSDPRVSPDGSKIAYARTTMIHVMNIDGSGDHELEEGNDPSWSPDGSRIIFSKSSGIFEMNADGTGVRQLTDTRMEGIYDSNPVWSPDGSRILFASNRYALETTDTYPSSYPSPYIMNADGSEVCQLVTTIGEPPYAWSPDGSQIVYTVGWQEEAILFLINADGSGSRPLISATTHGRYPVWRPGSDVGGQLIATLTRLPEVVSPTLQPGSAAPEQHLNPGQALEFSRLQMMDASTGWAFGGRTEDDPYLFHTLDGGETWLEVSPPDPLMNGTYPNAEAVSFFLDQNHGWVLYHSPEDLSGALSLWLTIDGGGTWDHGEPLVLPIMGEFSTVLLHFVDPNNGWLLTQSVAMGTGANTVTQIQRTLDGGLTWSEGNAVNSCFITEMTFFNRSNGWLSHYCIGPYEQNPPRISTSPDGGLSWNWIDLSLPPTDLDPGQIYAYCQSSTVFMSSSTTGLLLANCYDNEMMEGQVLPVLYGTTDGWQSITGMRSAPANEVQILDSQHAWALGREIFFTDDGGASWSFIKHVAWDGQFSFVDTLIGWAIARADGESVLVKTEDGGLYWEQMDPTLATP